MTKFWSRRIQAGHFQRLAPSMGDFRGSCQWWTLLLEIPTASRANHHFPVFEVGAYKTCSSKNLPV